MSERKVVEYIFLYGDPASITGLVNDYIKIGFQPFGPHSVCRGTVGQCIVKYED